MQESYPEAIQGHLPTPIHRINAAVFEKRGINVFMKRDDLVHPVIQGNKWRKLQPVLRAYKRDSDFSVYSFGGAYSNHLHALSYLCRSLEIPCTCFVRGDGFDPGNPTLQFIKEQGAEIIFLSRSEYRMRHLPAFLQSLDVSPGALCIPEGGASQEALAGCAAIVDEVSAAGWEPDHWIVPVGTGTTVAGMLSSDSMSGTLQGIACVADPGITARVGELLQIAGADRIRRLAMHYDYHFGGFAKWKPALLDFIREFEAEHRIPLDPIYTAKACLAALTMAEQGRIPPGSTVMLVHTGGLQGRKGFEQRFGIEL